MKWKSKTSKKNGKMLKSFPWCPSMTRISQHQCQPHSYSRLDNNMYYSWIGEASKNKLCNHCLHHHHLLCLLMSSTVAKFLFSFFIAEQYTLCVNQRVRESHNLFHLLKRLHAALKIGINEITCWLKTNGQLLWNFNCNLQHNSLD